MRYEENEERAAAAERRAIREAVKAERARMAEAKAADQAEAKATDRAEVKAMKAAYRRRRDKILRAFS